MSLNNIKGSIGVRCNLVVPVSFFWTAPAKVIIAKLVYYKEGGVSSSEETMVVYGAMILQYRDRQ